MRTAPQTRLGLGLTYGVYPVMMLGSLCACRATWLAGAGEAVAVSAVVVTAGALIFLLERVHPKSRAWVPGRREWWRDLTASVVGNGLLPAVLNATFAGLGVAAGVALARAAGAFGLWPTGLWLPLQVYLALAVGELGHYWAHRLFHSTEWGWSVHAVHHSTAHMHFLAAGRNHPINICVMVLLKVLPLAALGVPAEVLALAAVFNGVNGQLQHANVEQRNPLLNWVFSTPDLHVWHHSKEPRHANANYGTNLILWDVLFGTRRLPAGEVTDDVGLDYPVPESLLGQLMVPFRWYRISALMHAAHGTTAPKPPWWLPLARYGRGKPGFGARARS